MFRFSMIASQGILSQRIQKHNIYLAYKSYHLTTIMTTIFVITNRAHII